MCHTMRASHRPMPMISAFQLVSSSPFPSVHPHLLTVLKYAAVGVGGIMVYRLRSGRHWYMFLQLHNTILLSRIANQRKQAESWDWLAGPRLIIVHTAKVSSQCNWQSWYFVSPNFGISQFLLTTPRSNMLLPCRYLLHPRSPCLETRTPKNPVSTHA
jgi:hypothetical protein